MKVSEKIRSPGTPACSGVGSDERPGQDAPRGHLVRSLGRVSCALFLSFREGEYKHHLNLGIQGGISPSRLEPAIQRELLSGD